MLQPVALYRPTGKIAWDDGSITTVSNAFDEDGDETDDLDHAVAIVAQAPDGWWHSMPISMFERAMVH